MKHNCPIDWKVLFYSFFVFILTNSRECFGGSMKQCLRSKKFCWTLQTQTCPMMSHLIFLRAHQNLRGGNPHYLVRKCNLYFDVFCSTITCQNQNHQQAEPRDESGQSPHTKMHDAMVKLFVWPFRKHQKYVKRRELEKRSECGPKSASKFSLRMLSVKHWMSHQVFCDPKLQR